MHTVAHIAFWFALTLGTGGLAGALAMWLWSQYVIVSTENYDIKMNMDMPMIAAFAGMIWLLTAAGLRLI